MLEEVLVNSSQHVIGVLFGDGIRPGVQSNILIAHHVGIEGLLSPSIGLNYRMFGTYSRNYGAFRVCADAECLGERVDERTDRIDQGTRLVIDPSP